MFVRPPVRPSRSARFRQDDLRTLRVPMLPAWGVVRDDGRERNQSLVLPAK